MWNWLHLILVGIILGWGAAIPIGPMNLEMMRRTLTKGMRFGFTFGLGACTADVTYLILISLGLIALFKQPIVLKVIAALGIVVLLVFAFVALKSLKTSHSRFAHLNEELAKPVKNIAAPLWQHYMAGYLFTLINAYTVIFWTTVSTQVVSMSHEIKYAIGYVGAGLLIGTVSWVVFLNTFLHFTRNKLTPKVLIRLNLLGALLLLGFAGYAVWRFF